MSLLKPMTSDGVAQRQVAAGDVLGGAETNTAVAVVGSTTLTGVQLASTIITRTGPVGAYTDTVDTAQNILFALVSPIQNLQGIQPNTNYRLRFVNTVAFAQTLAATANTGIILGTVPSPSAAASSFKDLLITILNGTPQQTFGALTTNGSAVLTGLTAAQTQLLSPGMIVTSASVGQQGTTILSVQPGVGVTLSGNANATNLVPVFYTVSPVIRIDALN